MTIERPRILLTNDDGVNAEGLRCLWLAVRDHADVVIVAPETEASGVGLSITIRNPIHTKQVHTFENTHAWSISGTPADCVKMAVSVLLDNPPDLILSGINRGSNAGRNVLYSGTVAAVIEGTMRGVPGIAFSCEGYRDPRYPLTMSHVMPIVHHVLEQPLPYGTFLNVNFPDFAGLGLDTSLGIRLCRQAQQYWIESPEERHHPVEGTSYHWLGGQILRFDEHPDSDIYHLSRGYVAGVPIQINDLTDHDDLMKRKVAFELLNEQSAIANASATASDA